jgi:hypothetical protein
VTGPPGHPDGRSRQPYPPAPRRDVATRRSRAGRPSRLLDAVVLGLGLVLALAVVATLATLRYGPYLDHVRALRETAARLSAEMAGLQPSDIERTSLQRLTVSFGELGAHLEPLRELVERDPLVGALRGAPVVGSQVTGLDALVAASDSLVQAGHLGVDIADQVVAVREAGEARPDRPLLPALVEVMVTSADEVDRIAALVDDASARLAAIPPEALPQIVAARDLMAGPLERYVPLLDAYRELDDVLPGMVGWGGERRYLVLAQNPAELRPSGGYAGTVGTIVFRDGELVEQSFIDVHKLDLQEGLPFVEAPAPLRDHLLGSDQSWRLADAAWSADFPVAARQAVEFYALETGQQDIDGVIAITTFAFDRLLEVVGPVELPEFGVTVQPGEVTMTLLGETRGPELTIENRKDILDELARVATRRLLALAPEQWPAMFAALQDIGAERMALAWLADEDGQRLAASAGWSGELRRDPQANHLYVVEANMAPTSKYNLVVDRSDSLVVRLDESGDALESLRLDWVNRAGEPGEPYASLRSFSTNEEGWYGSYVQVMVPAGSELVTASGRASEEVRGAGRVTEEAGRTVFGTYLLMPPGESTLTHLWTSPDAARRTEDGWEYRLVVQKQPGARPHPVAVRVDLPEGAEVVETTPGATVAGSSAHASIELRTDTELFVRYVMPEEGTAIREP